MTYVKHHRLLQKSLMVLILMGLFFQVQTVFACQMMDLSGSMDHCCCDDMASMKDEAAPKVLDMPRIECCDIDLNLNHKISDIDHESDPIALTPPPDTKPSLDLLILAIVTLWPELTVISAMPVARELRFDPAHPGTTTYLATQRLRI